MKSGGLVSSIRVSRLTLKAELKSIQSKLIAQLHQRLQAGVGPPTRTLLAKCIAKTYSLGDIYSVTATMNLCNDLLESKEDSAQQLSVKMAALGVLGALYESLGRLAGASYQDLFNILTKWLSRAESQVRAEIMSMLAKMVKVKKYAEDRVMVVRIAAVELTPLIDRCINRLEHLRGYADALSGYSLALAALIAGSSNCNLGIPNGKYSQASRSLRHEGRLQEVFLIFWLCFNSGINSGDVGTTAVTGYARLSSGSAASIATPPSPPLIRNSDMSAPPPTTPQKLFDQHVKIVESSENDSGNPTKANPQFPEALPKVETGCVYMKKSATDTQAKLFALLKGGNDTKAKPQLPLKMDNGTAATTTQAKAAKKIRYETLRRQPGFRQKVAQQKILYGSDSEGEPSGKSVIRTGAAATADTQSTRAAVDDEGTSTTPPYEPLQQVVETMDHLVIAFIDSFMRICTTPKIDETVVGETPKNYHEEPMQQATVIKELTCFTPPTSYSLNVSLNHGTNVERVVSLQEDDLGNDTKAKPVLPSVILYNSDGTVHDEHRDEPMSISEYTDHPATPLCKKTMNEEPEP
ncbi:unnamed protein product, partial [Mesorhabditis spiculigera]